MSIETEDQQPQPGPYDEDAPGAPPTGETVCPKCGGEGAIDEEICDPCEGSGFVPAPEEEG